MLEKPYTKNQIQAIIRQDKKFRFVDSFEDVQKYYDQKIYAIEANSVALKELINEGKFLTDERILKVQEGIYHIIDINSKEIDIKSTTRTEHIAYALYKEKGDKDFWNKVYQIKISPLFNYISEVGYGYKYELDDLIGKSIYIQSIGLVEEAKSYKVTWGVCGDFLRYDQETMDALELYQSYLYENSEEGQLEAYLQEQEDKYYDDEYNSIENQVERYNEDLDEENQLLDAHLDSQDFDRELDEYLDQMEDNHYNEEPEY